MTICLLAGSSGWIFLKIKRFWFSINWEITVWIQKNPDFPSDLLLCGLAELCDQ